MKKLILILAVAAAAILPAQATEIITVDMGAPRFFRGEMRLHVPELVGTYAGPQSFDITLSQFIRLTPDNARSDLFLVALFTYNDVPWSGTGGPSYLFDQQHNRIPMSDDAFPFYQFKQTFPLDIYGFHLEFDPDPEHPLIMTDAQFVVAPNGGFGVKNTLITRWQIGDLPDTGSSVALLAIGLLPLGLFARRCLPRRADG